MNAKELFKGIAVVIDDEINDIVDNEFDKSTSDKKIIPIHKILDQLDAEHIPYVKYCELPDDGVIENLQNVSFVLLDWKLCSQISQEDTEAGVRMPAGKESENDSTNIEFLKKLQETCFCPIFIFSNENIDSIILKLKQGRVYKKGSCNNILVKSKSCFADKDTLFNALDEWLKTVAPIYLLKEWDVAYQKSKSNLFIDFQNRSSNWTKILWKTHEGDGVNPCLELSDLISRSITTQMTPLPLESSIFQNCEDRVNPNELLQCLERQCFVQEKYLDKDSPEVGDVFKINNDYYVNIRPSCDLIPRPSCDLIPGSRDKTSSDTVELYLLKPTTIKRNAAIHDFYNETTGTFNEGNIHCIIFPVCDGHLFHFKFKDLEQKKWKDLKAYRVGRLLPPFITKLQMKYSYYLQRQGFPKIPKEIFPKTSDKT